MTKKTYKIKVQNIDKIFELNAKGISLRDIAKIVGLSQEGVRYWLNKYQFKNKNNEK